MTVDAPAMIEEPTNAQKPRTERRARQRHPLNYFFDAPQDILDMRDALNRIGPWTWSCRKDYQVGYCIQSLVGHPKKPQRIQINGDQLGRGPNFFLSFGSWGESPDEVKFREQVELQFMTQIAPAINASNFRGAARADQF